MIIKKSTINFNKEMVFAEFGSFICTPLVAYLFSMFTEIPKYISFGAVVGGILGSSIMFIATRLWDKNSIEKGKYAARELIGDLIYFTPVALTLALIIYYPVVFFLSKYLLAKDYKVTISAMLAQLGAFTLMATCLNIYRIILRRKIGKEL